MFKDDIVKCMHLALTDPSKATDDKGRSPLTDLWVDLHIIREGVPEPPASFRMPDDLAEKIAKEIGHSLIKGDTKSAIDAVTHVAKVFLFLGELMHDGTHEGNVLLNKDDRYYVNPYGLNHEKAKESQT